MEEYPRIRSLSEGIDTLFPYLTTQQKKELLDGIRRALMEVLGGVWGEREVSVDNMREEMRRKLESEIRGIATIPEDERRRILSRLEKLIPAEELVRLKGKIKHSLLNRFRLKESVVKAFKRILEENLRGKMKLSGEFEEMLEGIEKVEEILEGIEKGLEGESSGEGGRSAESEGNEGQKSDDRKSKDKKIESMLKDVEEILDNMLREGEVKESERAKNFESECERELLEFIRELRGQLLGEAMSDKIDINREEIKKELDRIRDKISKIEHEVSENGVSEIEKIKSKIDKLENKVTRDGGIYEEIIESYGIKEEIRELCEEIERSVDISAYLVEGAESIIVENMNKMLRKDLSLYISWSLGNPMREFYYRFKRGEVT